MTTLDDLEKRVAALERDMKLRSPIPTSTLEWKDWRQTLDRFTPSEMSQEIDAAGQAIREDWLGK